MATRITPEQIKQMNELYLQIGTYAGVSRAMGGTPSPTTIKKYIVKDYKPTFSLKKKEFKKSDLPEFSTEMFCGVKNFGDLCVLSNEENNEMKELWEELSI